MSSIYHRPQRGGASDSRYQQQKRTVTHSQIFWFKMSVGFNSVVGENVTAFTEPEGFDAICRGAWTDLQGARILLSQTDSDWQFSSTPISLRSIFGNSNEVLPLKWWGSPVYLNARSTLKGDWINTAAEAAGTVCIYSEKTPMLDMRGTELSPGDKQIIVSNSQMYQLRLDLSKTESTTDPVNNDLLIWGASTNIETSATIGRIFNETTNYAWSSQQIPIRAMAGVDGQVQPIMRYHKPYLLPANVKLRGEINAAVPGGYMQFICERLLS
jgi:hypothetical protein